MSFIEATRQNLATFTSLPYNPGQVSYVDIARVGLMSTVKLRFKGKLTAKHASKTAFTRHELAPYNLADRL